ncbi:hypothetical protein JTE90_026948 [Oedothorax gibbosus]|uniref:Uncharacterized protein n=1 Tax=Oedothorax gibbosus TaxID=931172 RepID=A0AAV6UVI2_9ARAC|nr:hypothetical protein JTE90_026948 [Oedothorax gibbosus]
MFPLCEEGTSSITEWVSTGSLLYGKGCSLYAKRELPFADVVSTEYLLYGKGFSLLGKRELPLLRSSTISFGKDVPLYVKRELPLLIWLYGISFYGKGCSTLRDFPLLIWLVSEIFLRKGCSLCEEELPFADMVSTDSLLYGRSPYVKRELPFAENG